MSCLPRYPIASAGPAASLNPADYLAEINARDEISGWGYNNKNGEWIDLQLSVTCSAEPEMLESTTSGPGRTISGPGSTTSSPSRTTSGPSWTRLGPNWTNLGPSRTNSGPGRTNSGPVRTNSGPGQSTSDEFLSQFLSDSDPGQSNLDQFWSPYMTFLSLSILFIPLTKHDPHFSPTVQ